MIDCKNSLPYQWRISFNFTRTKTANSGFPEPPVSHSTTASSMTQAPLSHCARETRGHVAFDGSTERQAQAVGTSLGSWVLQPAFLKAQHTPP